MSSTSEPNPKSSCSSCAFHVIGAAHQSLGLEPAEIVEAFPLIRPPVLLRSYTVRRSIVFKTL